MVGACGCPQRMLITMATMADPKGGWKLWHLKPIRAAQTPSLTLTLSPHMSKAPILGSSEEEAQLGPSLGTLAEWLPKPPAVFPAPQ